MFYSNIIMVLVTLHIYSKPCLLQSLISMILIIHIQNNLSSYQNKDKINDDDDIKLYYGGRRFVDVESNTGTFVSAVQKLVISMFIRKNQFEIDNMFVPIYYLFRSGNFTKDSVFYNNLAY